VIPVAQLDEALAKYQGFSYAPLKAGLRDCRYPIAFAPFVDAPPPRQTDCVTYAVGVVLGAAHLAGLQVDWPLERHRRALVSLEAQAHALAQARAGDDAAGERLLYGLPDALVAAGLAELVPAGERPPAWSVVQGWAAGWRSGHAVLVRRVEGELLEVCEASSLAGRVRRRWTRRLPWVHVRVARLLC
jgi:hypothetical protein